MKQAKFLPMNMNEVVFVQLTELGKSVHRAAYDELVKNGLNPETVPYEYTEDKDGWSPWQFHAFIKIFGSHMDGMTQATTSVLKTFTILLPEKHLGFSVSKQSHLKLNH